jgi:phosphohistidine phosphatase
MRVYLVRHGKASKDPAIPSDAERPLTARGRSDAEALARLVAASGIQVHQIRHSGLLRAQQTAEIFALHLNPPGGVVAVDGLLFDDPVESLARDLIQEPEPVMFVGHNPFMERLVSLLLTGNPDRVPVSLGTSSTVCLENTEGVWSALWVLHRELVAGGDKD